MKRPQNNGKPLRAALYARVSTSLQDAELQLTELRAVAAQRNWQIVEEFVDQGISGACDRRPALDRLTAAAHAGKIDLVAVWKFDRFARSTRHLLEALETFRALNVGFISLREQIDSTTPMGKAMFTMISAVAELERDLIRERVVAGVQRAKARGVKVGRPERSDVDPIVAATMRRQGLSYNQIAHRFGCGKGTILKAILAGQKTLDEPPPKSQVNKSVNNRS
jgi:DNA invertase Pin-like site-specific DNA recombinase